MCYTSRNFGCNELAGIVELLRPPLGFKTLPIKGEPMHPDLTQSPIHGSRGGRSAHAKNYRLGLVALSAFSLVAVALPTFAGAATASGAPRPHAVKMIALGATTTNHSVRLVSLNEMPPGWTQMANRGIALRLPPGTKLGHVEFAGQNPDPWPLNIEELLYKFPSVASARAAANHAAGALQAYFGESGGVPLVSNLTPMSFPGIVADRFLAYSAYDNGGQEKDDIFVVRDGTKVALFDCYGGDLSAERTTLVAATT